MLELDRLYHIRRDFEVVIVNDASTDRTRTLLKWWKDNGDWRFLIKHLKTNMGFGPAVNVGAKAARGEFIFIISNDVEIKGDFIEGVLNFLNSEPDNDFICTARVIDWPAGWNEFPPHEPIAYAEGWFLGMRSTVWRNLRGFDERYIPYDYEDIDLSYAAAENDIYLRQVPLPLHHLGAGTIGSNPQRRATTEKHRVLFAEKWGLKWSPVR